MQRKINAIRRYCEAFGLEVATDYDGTQIDYPEDVPHIFPIAGEGQDVGPEIYLEPGGTIQAQFDDGTGPVHKQEGGTQPVRIEHIDLAIRSGVCFSSYGPDGLDVNGYKGMWFVAAMKALEGDLT